jgi:hypothetical protein
MKRYGTWLKAGAFAMVLAGIAWVTPTADGAKPKCPRDIECPQVYDPVVCNGVEYPNRCFAYRACCPI